MPDPSANDLVLYRLDELKAGYASMDEKIDALMIDVAMLKVKAGMWGAVAGLIPASVALILVVVTGG